MIICRVYVTEETLTVLLEYIKILPRRALFWLCYGWHFIRYMLCLHWYIPNHVVHGMACEQFY